MSKILPKKINLGSNDFTIELLTPKTKNNKSLFIRFDSPKLFKNDLDKIITHLKSNKSSNYYFLDSEELEELESKREYVLLLSELLDEQNVYLPDALVDAIYFYNQSIEDKTIEIINEDGSTSEFNFLYMTIINKRSYAIIYDVLKLGSDDIDVVVVEFVNRTSQTEGEIVEVQDEELANLIIDRYYKETPDEEI
jgi:hypothetical protein